MFEAVLLHEQLHSSRQFEYGVTPWLARYLWSPEFMWAEERLGWRVQLAHLMANGMEIDAEGVARNLAKYVNLRGAMINYEDALAWVRAVLREEGL